MYNQASYCDIPSALTSDYISSAPVAIADSLQAPLSSQSSRQVFFQDDSAYVNSYVQQPCYNYPVTNSYSYNNHADSVSWNVRSNINNNNAASSNDSAYHSIYTDNQSNCIGQNYQDYAANYNTSNHNAVCNYNYNYSNNYNSTSDYTPDRVNYNYNIAPTSYQNLPGSQITPHIPQFMPAFLSSCAAPLASTSMMPPAPIATSLPLHHSSPLQSNSVDANDKVRAEAFTNQISPISNDVSGASAERKYTGRNIANDLNQDKLIDMIENDSRKRLRTAFSADQRRYLLSIFQQTCYPSRSVLESAANKLNVSVPVIQTWFKNTRSKQKKLTNTKNL